jgi:hypothetical protein
VVLAEIASANQLVPTEGTLRGLDKALVALDALCTEEVPAIKDTGWGIEDFEANWAPERFQNLVYYLV